VRAPTTSPRWLSIIAAATSSAAPAVDSFTKTSIRFSDGTSRKDPELVKLFVHRAKAAAKELGI